MSTYITEEEQLERIKKWWTKYNGMITVTVSCLFAIMAAYKYWIWHHDKVMFEASSAYERMMVAFSTQDEKAVRAFGNQLINEYPSLVYSDVARLTLAKLYVKHDNFAKAKKQLTDVAHHSKRPPLKQIAKIRIARILVAEKNFDSALMELSQIDDKAYMPMIHELKGDIFVATGDYQKAVKSYESAMTEAHKHGINSPFLEMKTNELANFARPATGTAVEPLKD